MSETRLNEPAEVKECRFCGVAIREFNFGTGKEWRHIASSDLPAGTPYKICRTYTVATPPETVGEWAGKLLGPRHAKEPE